MTGAFDREAFESTAFLVDAGAAGEMFASSHGHSTASAALSATLTLTAASSGRSAATASLSRNVGLHASSAGLSAATASVTVPRPLSLSSSGTSSATAAVTAFKELRASSRGSSSATASLNRATQLSLASRGSSSATVLLHVATVAQLSARSAGRSGTLVSLAGGTVASSAAILGVYASTTSVASAPSAFGSGTVSVLSSAPFSPGMAVIIGGQSYDVASTAPGAIGLSGPLRSDVRTGDEVAGVGVLAINSGHYAVGHRTLLDLEAMAPLDARLIDMQARHPVLGPATWRERSITLEVMLTARSYADRRADYEAFASSLDSLSGVVMLRWTAGNGLVREYQVSALSASADAWFNRATASLVAANPYAAQVA